MAGRIYEHFDVVIAGAGAAGVAAAVEASRQGARVCILEKGTSAGGSYVESGMSAFKAVTEHEPIPGFWGICTRRGDWVTLDPDELQRFYYARLKEAGVLLLTSAWVMEAALNNGKITHLTVMTREGAMQVEGDVYIDATGDGDLANLCSVPCTQGREDDGRSLPPFYCFTLSGCSEGWTQVNVEAELIKPLGLSGVRLYPGARDDEVNVMMLLDDEAMASSAIDRARADECLRAAIDPVQTILTRYSAFESAKMARHGSRVVFPEGRHPQGRTIIDSHDLVRGTHFPDWVVSNLTAEIELPGLEAIEDAPQVNSYDIPYRALTPVRIKNLLLSGRCISGTHRAHGSFRTLQATMVTGQAAGAAAALSLEVGGKVQKISVKKLQERMMDAGMKEPRWLAE